MYCFRMGFMPSKYSCAAARSADLSVMSSKMTVPATLPPASCLRLSLYIAFGRLMRSCVSPILAPYAYRSVTMAVGSMVCVREIRLTPASMTVSEPPENVLSV